MVKAFILILAIFFTYILVRNTINSMVLIIRQGQPRDDSFLDSIFGILTAILWGVFYYL